MQPFLSVPIGHISVISLPFSCLVIIAIPPLMDIIATELFGTETRKGNNHAR